MPISAAQEKRDAEARREVRMVVEEYKSLKNPSKQKPLRRISAALTRLERAFGEQRVRRILEEDHDFTAVALGFAQSKVFTSGTVEGARPHFYLALDHCVDPQIVRDTFFKNGIEILDERRPRNGQKQTA